MLKATNSGAVLHSYPGKGKEYEPASSNTRQSDLVMADEQQNTVQATERSLDIIEALQELDRARLTTLAKELGLPNSTLHNHLSTLEQRGYVVRENEHYRLSLRFLDIGEYTRDIRKVYRVARPELDEIASETGEIASLVVEENGRGVFLYSAAGEEAISLDTSPGTYIHMHASAMGKAILAQLPEDEVAAILDQHGLPERTQNTIINRDSLLDELETIREQGVAIDDEERVRGSRSVAVAIRDEAGSVIGSIGISGPASTLTTERMMNTLAEQLHDTTNIIELKLAYS